MNKHKKNKTSGITILSLVVTVIVLLILAGISITMLSGDNGILLNVANAKERTEIKREEEIVEQSVLEAINKDKFGDLTLSKLSNYLGINSKDGARVELVDGEFVITFKDTERIFKVNKDGNVEYLGTSSVLKNTATITVSPEKNEYPMLAQSTEITISTIIKKQDDEVIVHYGWSKDKKTEPKNYRALSDYTTITERKRTGTAIIDDAEGSYYLWVQVLLDNNVITQKFGPYNIKSHTSLVSTSGERKPTSGFLGSNKFENSKVVTRSTINSVKISDTFTDKNGVTHTINDNNCWDVSQAQDGKSILAWYEVAYDSEGNEVKNSDGNTMYNITIAQEGGVTAAVNSSCLFYNVGQGGTGIDVITGLDKLDTQMTTDMSYMFKSSTVRELDLSHFDTRKVTTFAEMFNGCKGLTVLDLNNFDTRSLKSMYAMFWADNNLNAIYMDKFNTSEVTSIESMFRDCSNLQVLDLSKWDTSKVTTMQGVFNGCKNLINLDIGNFKTNNVKDMTLMFNSCNSLISLDVSEFNTEKVTKMSGLFSGCNKLTSLDVTNFNTSNVTNMSSMFSGCSGLTSLDVTNFNTSNVTSMSYMFYNCSGLTSLNVSNFETSKVTNMHSMFEKCLNITTLDVSNFNTANVTDMAWMFGSYNTISNFTSINVSSFDTSKVTTMESMFRYCANLTVLDVSSFDTSNVKKFGGMFLGCKSLTELNVNNFNTSSATGLTEMFASCSGLTTIDVSNFNTENVITMNGMFSSCTNLKSVNVSSFNTSNVTNMTSMFNACYALESLDLRNFDTKNVISMKEMFRNTRAITQILVSSLWVVGENTNIDAMFTTSNIKSVTYE